MNEDSSNKVALDYLANLLVRAYLDKKCREAGHKFERCDDCRYPLSDYQKPTRKRKKSGRSSPL